MFRSIKLKEEVRELRTKVEELERVLDISLRELASIRRICELWGKKEIGNIKAISSIDTLLRLGDKK